MRRGDVHTEVWLCSEPLTQSLRGARVCLFAHYDRDRLIDDYVVYHLAALARAGVINILITTAPILAAGQLDKVSAVCAAVLQRDNLGLDFGSWRTALLVYPEIWSCETLLLANDSVYGPLRPLEQVLAQMAAPGGDFWGISESLQLRSHYQSYFLGFPAKGLQKEPLQKFLRGLRLLTDKEQIIQRYEVSMKGRLSAQGLKGAALIPARPGQTDTENPTLHRWKELLAAGSPYLKVQLLRENPHQQPIADWPEFVRAYGHDPALPDLIERHLRRFRPA